MDFGIEKLREQIPAYLTRPQQEKLLDALLHFPKRIDYYLNAYHDELLQGDGWAGLEIVNFENGGRRSVRGILLSNSCDIDNNNNRALPARLLFAPLIKLAAYIALLKAAGLASKQIEDKISAIKEQNVTSIFFLPAGAALNEDHIALLDDVHTIPADYYRQKGDRQKLFTLDMVGFYLFLFKLSIHFCRFHEGVNRFEPA